MLLISDRVHHTRSLYQERITRVRWRHPGSRQAKDPRGPRLLKASDAEAAALVLLATRDAHKDGHGLGGGGSGDGDGGGGSGGKATSRKGRRWPNLLDLPGHLQRGRWRRAADAALWPRLLRGLPGPDAGAGATGAEAPEATGMPDVPAGVPFPQRVGGGVADCVRAPGGLAPPKVERHHAHAKP